jgi:hypothetical protein
MRQDPHLCDPCIEEDARHNGHADLVWSKNSNPA